MSQLELAQHDRQNHPLDQYTFEHAGYSCSVKYGPLGNCAGNQGSPATPPPRYFFY